MHLSLTDCYNRGIYTESLKSKGKTKGGKKWHRKRTDKQGKSW